MDRFTDSELPLVLTDEELAAGLKDMSPVTDDEALRYLKEVWDCEVEDADEWVVFAVEENAAQAFDGEYVLQDWPSDLRLAQLFRQRAEAEAEAFEHVSEHGRYIREGLYRVAFAGSTYEAPDTRALVLLVRGAIMRGERDDNDPEA